MGPQAVREPAPDVATRKGFTSEAKKWMAERSAAFQKGTQKRRMPMFYGKGEPPKKKR